MANPTINSYKRLVPGYEAPCYLSWSAANRSALVRVPAARGNSTRAEFRSPDPMCNPYLTFACMLAAGLDGIKNKIMPPESTNTNIYHLNAKDRKRLQSRDAARPALPKQMQRSSRMKSSATPSANMW